jgi:hypothetical protein
VKERYTRGKENNERKKKRQKTLRCESKLPDQSDYCKAIYQGNELI